MNSTNINTELAGNQQVATLPLSTHEAQTLPVIQAQAHEIEARVGNVAVIIESMFDQLDTMKCHTPADHKLHESLLASANALMHSARAICNANESIFAMIGGVQ